jgi:hypothetical protein
MRATLRAAFTDDVALLTRLLGRDLQHWLGDVTGATPRDGRNTP